MRASTVGGVFAWLLWCVCASAAAFGVWRQDALVAVTWEKFSGPVAFALLHLPVAFVWDLFRKVVARWAPVLAGVLAPMLPLLVLGFWGLGLSQPSTRPAPAQSSVTDRQDIVLVTIDAVRADRVGPERGLTPQIDAIAGRGTTFRQAITTSPVTAPAHASLLTGLEVDKHQLFANGAVVKVPTLTESVRGAGFRTGAFVSAHVLDRESRLQAGFQHYDDRWGFLQRMRWLPISPYVDRYKLPPRRSGAETVDQALRWLYADEEPAFLWVHLFDAHGPYAPPSEFQPPVAAVQEARRIDREDMRARGSISDIGWKGKSQLRQQTLMYDSSVRWVDALVGRLVGKLRGDPVVIVVGVHGESLGEHETYFSHGGTVWEEAVRVPMVVRWPGRFETGQQNDELVSTRAVARLVLQAAGVEPIEAVSPEPSVLVYTTGQEAVRGLPPREKENYTARQTAALRYAGGKLVAKGGDPVRWYDLAADPQELTAQPVPEHLAADAASLQSLVDAPPPRLSDHQRRRLEALGYVE